jgi:hypothetical protein
MTAGPATFGKNKKVAVFFVFQLIFASREVYYYYYFDKGPGKLHPYTKLKRTWYYIYTLAANNWLRGITGSARQFTSSSSRLSWDRHLDGMISWY